MGANEDTKRTENGNTYALEISTGEIRFRGMLNGTPMAAALNPGG